MIYTTTLLIACLLSIFLSALTIKISERLRIFSKTNREGENGKPCLGGVAIFAAMAVTFLVVCFQNKACDAKLIGLMISSGLIILLGIIDDIKELGAWTKIFVELIAIGILILFGFFTRIMFLPVWLNVLITIIWVLFITNAFNLLDIVDGLTSGLVVIISLTLLTVSIINQDIFSSIILIALIGAHLGFLKYNYPPARLYMGDTGSLFSGFVLAAMAINISYAPLERPVALITPILAMSLAIYDTVFLIIMRLKKGKPMFSKTNDHFALRLMNMGYSVHKSLWIMYLFSIFLAIASVIVAFSHNLIGSIVLIVVLFVFISMGKRVGVVGEPD